MVRGFEWFVAWRYLRKPPRGGRISGALALWCTLLGGYCLVRALWPAGGGEKGMLREVLMGRPVDLVVRELLLVALGTLALASAVMLPSRARHPGTALFDSDEARWNVVAIRWGMRLLVPLVVLFLAPDAAAGKGAPLIIGIIGAGVLFVVAQPWLLDMAARAARPAEFGPPSAIRIVIRTVLLLLAAAAAWLVYQTVTAKTGRHIDIETPLIDWRTLYKIIGQGTLAFASWCAVFCFIKRRQTFFTAISTFGVFLGSWALVVALSVMNGFEADLRAKILGSNAHVRITGANGAFGDWRRVMSEAAKVDGVIGLTPYAQSEVVLAPKNGQNYAGIIIKGIDPHTVTQVSDLDKNLKKGARLERLWPIAQDGGPLEYGVGSDAGPIDPGAGRDGGPGLDTPDAGDPFGTYEPPTFDGAEGEEGGETGGDPFGNYEPPTYDEDGPDAGPEMVAPGPPPPDLLDLNIGIADPTIIDSNGREVIPEADVALLDGILVGTELNKNLHLFLGQEVHVVSPLATDVGAQGEKPRLRDFRVAGTFYTGMYEYDTKTGYVSLPALQTFLSMGDTVDGIEVKVVDRDNTGPVVQALIERLGKDYVVQDWKELNRGLFSALKLEKIAMFLVLTIIILVASFSIVSNLIMIVVEKAKEIAILKAQGASDGGVMRVFMIEGVYIGVMGAGLGVLVGVATCVLFQQVGIPVPADVYYIDRLPVNMDGVSIILVALASVAISFLATIYPAWVAARLQPVDGLRHE